MMTETEEAFLNTLEIMEKLRPHVEASITDAPLTRAFAAARKRAERLALRYVQEEEVRYP